MTSPGPFDLFAALDLLVLRRTDAGTFGLVGRLPEWSLPFLEHAQRQVHAPGEPWLSESCLAEMFPFLESFLFEAAEVWEGSRPGPVASVISCATLDDGHELLLIARALCANGEKVLIIDGSQYQLREHAALLQLAREGQLVLQRLQRDVVKRDILFHSIVHDLTTQLSSIRGALELLQREDCLPNGHPLLDTGLRAVGKQESLIRDILDVFQSDTGGMESTGEVLQSCHIGACIEETIRLMRPAAMWRRVDLRAEFAGAQQGMLVAAERSRLERVIGNLIDNALRHAPRGTKITVSVSEQSDDVLVTVDDEGPGVAEELGATLFARFARGRGGKTGLGLYFCHLTITRWGGRIGYAPRRPAGARFWFCLPRKTAAQPESER